MQHVLEVKRDKAGDVEVVRLSGALDTANADMFIHHMQPLCEKGARVIVDCLGLSYVNSMCFALLNKFSKECAGHGGRLVFCRVPSKILQIMKLLGLDQSLKLFNTMEEAIKAVG